MLADDNLRAFVTTLALVVIVLGSAIKAFVMMRLVIGVMFATACPA